MTATRNLEQRLAAYYESERPFRAPDRVLLNAVATIEQTNQRRVLPGVLWRLPSMSNNTRLALAALAAVAVVGLGLAFVGGGLSGIGNTPGPSPSQIIPSPSPTMPALTETFSSELHGMSVGHPAGWRIEPAGGLWTAGLPGTDDPPSRDTIWNGNLNEFIGIASQPLAGRSPTAWTTQVYRNSEWDAQCDLADSRPVTVDGVSGIVASCPERPLFALAADDRRGYFFVLYGLDDQAFFDEVLATVELEPDAALWSSAPFTPGFRFDLPDSVGFDFGDATETYFELRVPAWAEAGHPGGLIAEKVGGGRVDPCDETSATLALDAGGQAVFDYLAAVPGLQVGNVEPFPAIGGADGQQATVTSDGSACDPLFAWDAENNEPFSAVPLDAPRRLVALDVSGEHLVFTIYGEERNPEWPEMADELLRSIQFGEP